MNQPYILTDNNDVVIRAADKANIPVGVNNIDSNAYNSWLSEGNTPDPYVAPPVSLITAAQAALNKSDITIIRCYSAGIPVPSANQTYRNALRSIVNGTDTTSTVLPEEPVKPVGI